MRVPWCPTNVGSGRRAPGKSLLSADMVCLRAKASDTRRYGEFDCACAQCSQSADTLRAARHGVPPSDCFQLVFSQAACLDALADRHTPAGPSGVYPPMEGEIAPTICAPRSNSALPHSSNGGSDFTFAAARIFRCDSPEFRGPSAATSVQAGSSNWIAIRLKLQRLVACASPSLSWRWWWLG